jgi:CheY-like chemotaxis protein
VEAGRLDVRLQPVDLPPVLDDVAAVIAPLAGLAGVEIEWPPTAGVPRVLADPIRLRQVLVNLLTNAVKFTPSGGRAWLEIEADPEGVCLAVCDTGRGIPPSETQRIFEPFERGDGVQAQGVGLGLAICRRIVELHGSRLELSSQPEIGSRFWFRLRRSREPLPPRLLRPSSGQTAVLGHDGLAASVLVVEDDVVSRQSISDVLSVAGYRVRSVASRRDALEAIAGAAMDAVVLDVQLPDGSGLEIIGSLRSAVDRPLAVVVLSADRIGDTAERAMAAGCDRFGLKPIAARDLLALIADAVEERRAGSPARPQG